VSLTDDVNGVLELIDGALGDAVPVEAGLVPAEPDDGDDNSIVSDAMRWTAEPAKGDDEAYCPPGGCALCDASIAVSESPGPTFDDLIVVFGDGRARQWQDGAWVEVEPGPETVETVDGMVLHVTPRGETTSAPVGPDPEVRRGMDPWEPLLIGDRVEVVGVAGWPGRVTEVAGPFASVVFPNGDVHSFGKDQLTLIGEIPDG
jgi:hypothetical protein